VKELTSKSGAALPSFIELADTPSSRETSRVRIEVGKLKSRIVAIQRNFCGPGGPKTRFRVARHVETRKKNPLASILVGIVLIHARMWYLSAT
jgi:hypothetical protein